MSLENTNLSRRNLLRAGALGVPAAGVLAFGSTLVTATSANAISTDGWWGEETSAGLQRLMNAVFPQANLIVDGWISSQPSLYARDCPGIIGGWEWVPDDQAVGSPTIYWMRQWVFEGRIKGPVKPAKIAGSDIEMLQSHYGVFLDGRLDAPSQTIMALQNEINQYVG